MELAIYENPALDIAEGDGAFDTLCGRLEDLGIDVQRMDRLGYPEAFMENEEVRETLEQEGPECLPMVFLDEVLVCSGHYPGADEAASWFAFDDESSCPGAARGCAGCSQNCGGKND